MDSSNVLLRVPQRPTTRHCGKVLRIAFVAWATGGALVESIGDTPSFLSLGAATTMPTVDLDQKLCRILLQLGVAAGS